MSFFFFLIIYFIVHILDHVDQEDLPCDVLVCDTVYHSTTKQNNISTF